MNIQYSNSSNVPRYDRLTDRAGTGLKYADWYYGPQTRLMAAYDGNWNNIAGFEQIHLGVNYQSISESRFTRRFNSSNRTGRNEAVQVVGYTLNFSKKINTRNDLRFGLDGQFNTLKSTAEAVNLITNVSSKADTRYPDGDNSLMHNAIYASHTWHITPKLILNDGLRLTNSMLNSTLSDKTFFPLPYDKVAQNNTSLVGNVGLIYLPTENWKLSLLGSTGFRAPNVDDVSKIFESGGGILIVPNNALKPEKTLNGDLGITYMGDEFRWETNIFATSFTDAIVTDKFTYNGQDSVVYDGTKSAVFANQNKQKAYLYGASTLLKIGSGKGFGVNAGMSYTYGRIVTDNGETNLDHIPPVTGRIGVSYQKNRFSSELFSNFSGTKLLNQYYLNGEDNEQYATPLGMPGWYTLNWHSSLVVAKNMTLQMGIDNIFDTNYRTFASGIHGAGRNVFLAVRASW